MATVSDGAPDTGAENSEFEYQQGIHEETAGAPDVSVLSGGDSTVGDEPTESGRGPEELDDPTADGRGIATPYGDGVLREDGTETDAFDDIMDAPQGGESWSGSDGGGMDDYQLPEELDADAMGRPEHGSMNDDDQGMQNAR